MIDLERALTDLADHLDYPASASPGSDAASADLRRRLVAAPAAAPQRARALLVAAAAIVVVATGVVAIAPARHAVADWLGIGAVEVRRTESTPLPPTSTTVRALVDPKVERALADARRAVGFRIAIPSRESAGSLTGVTVNDEVPGGVVDLRYPRFTLVEIATDPAQPPPLRKMVDNQTSITDVTVAGRPGMWIAAPHAIAYIDRAGAFVNDTLRRSGPVLLWERDGVTYRIEGLESLDQAQAVADSLH